MNPSIMKHSELAGVVLKSAESIDINKQLCNRVKSTAGPDSLCSEILHEPDLGPVVNDFLQS